MHWNTAAWNIPHVGDNCPTRPYHPRHFSDRLARIGKKGDHQSHHSNIEAVVSEGQILSIARAEIRHLRAGPCPSIGELIIGRIDRRDSTGRRASNQLVCECAVSAADIEPREILRSIDPIQKCFTNNSTPSAHQPLVRCSVCEELVRFTHAIMCDGDAAPPQTEYGPRGIISRHRHYLKSFEKGATLALGLGRVKTPFRGSRREGQDRPVSGRDRGHQRLVPNDVHDPGQIVGQDREGHLGGYFWEGFGQEVRRTHARLHGAERMLDGLAT